MVLVTMAGVLVGRDQLVDRVADALSDPGCPVTVLCGEPGIGKTSLLRAAVETAARRGRLVLQGWCLDLSEPVPFLPVVDVLRQAAAVDEGRLMKSALSGCPAYVEEEVRVLLPELGDEDQPRHGAVAAAPWRRDRVLAAVQRLLGELSDLAPVSVAIEDLHWADPSSVDWLRYLGVPVRGAPVPLVLTTRVEGAAALHEVVVRAGGAWVDVEPLPAQAVRALVEGRTGRGTVDVERIVQLSAGNPLFAERLILAGPDGGTATDVLGLFARELTDRSPDERQLMAALAVAGRTMAADELAELTGLPEAEVVDGLRALVRHRIVDRGTVDRTGASGFDLHHALLAEAVRGDLTAPEARRLHRRAAEVLSRRGDEAVAAEVADHYRAAGRPVDEAGWRLRAARHADAVAAPVEAVRHWERLVAMARPTHSVPEGAEISLADLYLDTFSAMERAGSDRLSALATEAETALLPGLEDVADRVSILRVLGRWRASVDPVAGMGLIRQAVELGAEHPPTPSYIRALVVLAHRDAPMSQGRYHADLRLLHRARAAAHALSLPEEERYVLAVLAWRHMRAGEQALARAALDGALALRGADPDPWNDTRVLAFATDILLKLGNLDEVVELGTPGIRDARDAGVDRTFPGMILLSNVLEALAALGRTQDAATLSGDLDGESFTRTSAPALVTRAAILLAAGDLAPAGALWEAADARSDVWDESFQREFALLKGEFLLWRGRAKEVVELAIPILRAVAPVEEGRFAGSLFTLALRACADRTEASRAGVGEGVDGPRADARELDGLRGSCAYDPFTADVPSTATAEGRTWEAEWARAHAQPAAEAWARAADAWLSQGRPHRAAYALYRQAEAEFASPSTRAAAAQTLRAAYAQAAGHAPLLEAVETLARLAHTTLAVAAPPRLIDPAQRPFALTERELDVLTLLAQGLTNVQIGRRLYMSPKTASVHVSGILRKLGVTSRVQAAAMAAQAGLVPRTLAREAPGD